MTGSTREAGEWQRAVLLASWNSITTPTMVIDEELVVRLANPAAVAELRASGSEVGRPVGPLTVALTTGDGTPVTEANRPLRRAIAEPLRDEEFTAPSPEHPGLRRLIISGHPLAGPDGERLALIAWRDVTDRWQVEATRKAALAQLHQLLDGADDYALMMLDPQGRIVTWSPSARRLTRYDDAEVVGRHVGLLFQPADQQAGIPEAILARAAATGRAATEGRRVRRDGTVFWSRGVVTAQRDSDDTLRGFVKVAHDVTDEHHAKEEVAQLNAEMRALNHKLELRIAERTEALARQAEALARQAEALAEANRELEGFSYSVSHDLRAPLRAMAGFARILADDYAEVLDDDGLHLLGRIQAAAEQMRELIEGLLAFSRLQRQRLAEEPLDMTAMARSAWQCVALGHDEEEIDIQPMPASHGDPQLVAHVWINLLENAVKFTSQVPRRRIRVWAEPRDGACTYCVADNGAGFDPEFAGKLFQPFSRLHRAEDFPGTGVGLALVDRILRRHGGSIRAEGAPGAGACFRFTLGPAS